jgi:tRNA U34 5-carboxymethylaminomethyl modifying enzyme MnmG/GidA
VANPFCGPDAPNNDPAPPGKSTPSLILARVKAKSKEFERQNLMSAVDANPATAQFNATLNCIVTNIPCLVTKQNHQTATVIRQIAG